MKVMLDRFFLLLVFLAGAFCSFAAKGKEPPQPNPAGKNNSALTTFSGPGPPPPGLPIDENILILIIIALLFGIYIIYNHRLKTKASM
ncbi:hypothetical protein FQU23_002890 [Flavobacterium sp. XN-5]|uniref:hypothetical protein n=1 Tax=Flavobacterium sp. XN-5 TaxID=2599390 RepID=UPI0011C8DA7D|nr:hypothetical protein [Flavobacterium sp. XN-5]NGY36453.1 hypothetical protein [Flavobacterium sp. XN-5]